MTKYSDYIKGGELLLAPSLHYEDQYTLQCYECKEHYNQLELFVAHCIAHVHIAKDEEAWPQHDLHQADMREAWPQHGLHQADIKEAWHQHDLHQADIKELDETKESSIKCDIRHIEMDPLNSTGLDLHTGLRSENIVVKVEPYGDSDTVDDPVEDEDYETEEELTDESSSENVDANDEPKKKRLKSTSFVRNFTKSKENMAAFIAAYKNQPKLWNRTITNIGTQERHRMFQEIINELQKLANLDLSHAQVTAVITHLRYTYKVKLKGRQKKQNVAKQWYLEELGFLTPFIECNLRSTLDSFKPEITDEHLKKILAIYEKHPILWNSDLIENCCENKREEALACMVNAVKSDLGLTVNANSLKGYIEAIRDYITKEKYNYMNGKAVKVRPEYRNEMKFLHDHIGPFKCKQCERKLKNPLLFKIHKSEHDGTIPLICSLCKKEFKVIGSYTDHARRHMKDLREKCDQCGKRFLNAYNLMIHMRCHTGANPFCCEICGTSFRHIQSYATHKRRHEKKYLHNCPVCSKGFYKKVELSDHLRSHYNVRDYVCKTCGKAFKTRKTLAQHIVIHDDARKHACNICGKTFKLKIGVSQHMKTHGNLIEKSITMGST